MAGPEMTFDPEEEARPLTPQEKLQSSRQQAMEAHKHLQQAAPGFDFKRFKREFVPKLIAAYNRRAKAFGLPPLNPAWLDLLGRAKGGAAAPKDFYVLYRERLQPRIFPGDPAKAKKAYDLFLRELEKAPLIRSGPSSGMLSHETGHFRGYQTDPGAAIRSRRPRTLTPKGLISEPGAKPTMATAINEAIASYNGFKLAWEAWSKYGIPRKAWAAWSGFPTYTQGMSEPQVKELLRRLKKLNFRHPGIYKQARTALYEFQKYVEPVLYNVPGADWTDKEKAALKRFLKTRGGRYLEYLPFDEEERLRHMKRQPYVMREEEAPSRVASAFPLSIREAGEVVPFPSEKVTPPEEKEEPAQILSPALEAGSFVLFVKGFPVGWYDRFHTAAKAAKDMADAFIEGRPSLLGEAVHRDAPDEIADWMTKRRADITEPADIFLTDPRYRGTRERVAPMMVSVMSIGGSPPSPEQRSEGVPAGDLFDLEDRFLPVAEEAQDRLDWDRIAWATDAVNADIWKIVQEGIAGLE